MYTQFFNFKEPPFSIAPNPRFLYMSPRHQEALAHLLYGIGEGGGFIALTGEVGTGKTTLCRNLLELLPENVKPALLLNPHLNAVELLASLCDELRISYPTETTSLKILVDALNSHLLTTHASGDRTVLIIDEAQNLSYGVLEQIRLLTNLETTQTKLLQIILVGQPELTRLLKQNNLRQLSQRITARYHLGALSGPETKTYIEHRLRVSGCEEQLFSRQAMELIHRNSGGIPRLINVICDRALLGAYTQGKKKVRSAFVRNAANEVLPPQQQPRRNFFVAALSLVLAAIAVLVFYKPMLFRETPLQAIPAQLKTQQNDENVATAKAPPKTTPAPDEPATPVVNPTFFERIQDSALTMENAFHQLFPLWRVEMTNSHGIPCNDAVKQGFHCFAQRGRWPLIRRLNRPVILEIPLQAGSKRYVMLTGVRQNKAGLSLNGEQTTFSISEILPYWKGYYLLLWKPKYPTATLILPGNTHPAVGWIRSALTRNIEELRDLQDANYYDNALKKKVMEFQRLNGLKPDGIAGPQTQILLNNRRYDPETPTLNKPNSMR